MKYRIGVCDSDNNVCSLFEKEIREHFTRNGNVVEIKDRLCIRFI